MIVDEAGVLWLSNAWIATLVLVAVVGLVVWCHRWLEDGQAPMPRSVASRTRDLAMRRRRPRRQQAIRPAVVTVARSTPAMRPSLQVMRSDSTPRSAA